MEIYNLIIENKDLLKIFYGILITLICMIIVIKTNKLFKLSSHQGIRYFRNAFLFYGLAFLMRAFIAAVYLYKFGKFYFLTLNILFEFFLVMAGFFLLYSLLWKKLDLGPQKSSLANPSVFIFYIMTFVIILIDQLWQVYYLLFASQIFIFLCASIISFSNFVTGDSRRRFLKFYFIAMILSLTAWILNALAALSLWNQQLMLDVHLINLVIFFLFLIGVVKITQR